MIDIPSEIQIFTDGCAKGNPGPAGAGIALLDMDGGLLEEDCQALGHATNNEAEYRALIFAMERCIEYGVRRPHFFTDSELMERQLNGIYKIKNERIGRLAARVNELRGEFDSFDIRHIRREKNKRADRMANEALIDGRDGAYDNAGANGPGQ